MKNMSPEQLRELAEAAAALDDYAATVADRDNRIRRAHRAGMAKTEIASRIKASPNTVLAVLGDDEAVIALREELGRPLEAGDLARLRKKREETSDEHDG